MDARYGCQIMASNKVSAIRKEEEEEEEGMMRAWKRGMEGKRGEGGKAKKERISASVYASVNSSER